MRNKKAKGKKAAAWPELQGRIQALPQELQDHILDFALHVKPGIVNICADYKPPWQLTLDRKTRNTAAQHYYSTSTFKLSDGDYIEQGISGAWFKSLSKEHQGLLADVRVSEKGADGWPTMREVRDTTSKEAKASTASLHAQLSYLYLKINGVKIREGVLKFGYFMVVKSGRRGAVRIEEHWAS